MKIKDFEQLNWKTAVNSTSISNIDLSIDHYGYEITPTGKPRVTAGSTYVLHFVTAGKCIMSRNGIFHKIRKNMCFIFEPQNDIYWELDKIHPIMTHYWVCFTGKEAKNYLNHMGFNQSGYLNVSNKTATKLRQVFFENFTIPREQSQITDFIFMANFFRIGALLYSSATDTSSKAKKEKTYTNYINEALLFIKAHYTESSFDLSDLAEHLHLHKNYLSSLFKAEMGVAFGTYLKQRRMQLAFALIEQGYTSVTKIAEAVGIPDPSYFSKVFKKYNVISPKEEIEKKQNLQKQKIDGLPIK